MSVQSEHAHSLCVRFSLIVRILYYKNMCGNSTHRFVLYNFRIHFHTGFLGFCKAPWFAWFLFLRFLGRLLCFGAIFCWNLWRDRGWQGFWCWWLNLFDRWWQQVYKVRWVKIIHYTNWFFRGLNLKSCFNVVTMELGVNLSIAWVTADCSGSRLFDCWRSLLLPYLLSQRKFWRCFCYACTMKKRQE